MARCLYCLGLDGEPSVEHVVPAALGELATLTLPAEAVCRSCNNWTGIAIDEPFTQMFAVRFIRGIYRIPDERGKRVEALDLAPGTRVEFPAEGPWLIKMISPQAEEKGDFFAYDLLQHGPYRRFRARGACGVRSRPLAQGRG